nr:EOG090X081J [Eulimnadia texana]
MNSCFCQLLLIFTLLLVNRVNSLGKIIYAINAGGDAHTDIYGIKYQKDPLEGKVGIASDYGKQYQTIKRVPTADAVLYQTERYHHSTFGYDIPINEDGDYMLVLKFCEVYFDSRNMKVFDIVLNGVHTIVSYLDIYEKVGKAAAHDEYIPFRIAKGKVIVNNEESDLLGKKIKVEFIKGNKDNPKVNAIYVMKGTIDEIPKLPPMFSEPELEKMDERLSPKPDTKESDSSAKKKRSNNNARIPDPYMGDSSAMLPIFIAIAAFVPVLFCLCKL